MSNHNILRREANSSSFPACFVVSDAARAWSRVYALMDQPGEITGRFVDGGAMVPARRCKAASCSPIHTLPAGGVAIHQKE